MNSVDLDKLFNPRNIALVGASGNPAKWGHIILLNILKGNYPGTVYPVNLKEEAILGYKCYPSVGDIPDTVDLAMLTTPSHLVPSLIEECGKKNIPFVIVITSDFSETGPEGAELEREVVEIGRRYGVRIVGPNTMGIFSSKSNLHALMPPVMPLNGSVSMFSQSGNVGVQMLSWGTEEGVGFEKFVSSGNEGDLTCVDYLSYLSRDEATRVILAYLEGIDPGADLFPVAREVSRIKPILVFKGGRTEAGGKAAASHSGAMAGETRIYRAAFIQSGMIEVKTSQALMDCAKAFSNYPIPMGKRVGIITRGGGWGVITADFCEENGLIVPPLPMDIIDKFDKLLPKYWSRSNPVDLVATIAYDPYLECLEILTEWEGIDAIIALGAGIRVPEYKYSKEVKGPKELMNTIDFLTKMMKERAKKPDKMLESMGALVKRSGKPIIGVAIGAEATHKMNLERFQVVSYPTPERGVRVLRQMYKYRRFLNSPSTT